MQNTGRNSNNRLNNKQDNLLDAHLRSGSEPHGELSRSLRNQIVVIQPATNLAAIESFKRKKGRKNLEKNEMYKFSIFLGKN